MHRPSTITDEQAKQIIHWIDHRYKLVIQLAYESGLRISDLLDIRKADISSRHMRIYETKSRQIRKFTISEQLHADLNKLTPFFRHNDFVFPSPRDATKHVSRMTIHNHIKKAVQWLKIDCSAHSLRKLYAQSIYASTGNVEAVQRSLNHRKISTTYTYLDLTPDGKPISTT